MITVFEQLHLELKFVLSVAVWRRRKKGKICLFYFFCICYHSAKYYGTAR